MKIFNWLSERYHYLIDNSKLNNPTVFIDNFEFDGKSDSIIVTYHYARSSLVERLNIHQFAMQFTDAISHYDSLRLSEFNQYQQLLTSLFSEGACSKTEFINLIEERAKHAKLF